MSISPIRSSGLPARHSKVTTTDELEECVRLYVKYAKLAQEQADVMRHNPPSLKAAYSRVCAETQQNGIQIADLQSPGQIQAGLNVFARQCEIPPRTFDDRIQIAFAASAYVQIMVDCILSDPHRPSTDVEYVILRSTQLLKEDTGQPFTIPIFLPSIAKVIPEQPTVRATTLHDIAHWRLHPEHLVGKAFITTEIIMRRVFRVEDYLIKRTKGPQYDVVFEDTGLGDVNTFYPESLLEMVAEAELVTNM